MAGYLAAVLVFLTFYMKTMIPLRVTGICSNCVFITYGYLGGLYPVLILHLILLPLNGLRLRKMVRLTKHVREATQGDINMNWLKPFTSTRRVKSSEVLFRKGSTADAMFLSGHYRLAELGMDILPGQVVGELGLLAPEQLRTQTLECIEGGEMLQITYEQIRQIYYQNLQFGFYFLQLTSRWLFENIARMERELTASKAPASPAIYAIISRSFSWMGIEEPMNWMRAVLLIGISTSWTAPVGVCVGARRDPRCSRR